MYIFLLFSISIINIFFIITIFFLLLLLLLFSIIIIIYDTACVPNKRPLPSTPGIKKQKNFDK